MKIVKRIIVGIIIVLLVIIGGVYFFTKSTLPDYAGTITTEKVENKVEIIRDSYGVPHIFAENQNDLAFGLGYAMAQDRLWQMDILRRASLGRLSELFGTVALDADRFSRVLGFGRTADTLRDDFSAEESAYFEAFLSGINLYIETKPEELPLEFRIFGYEPEPFTARDILAVVLYQSFLNNHNWKFELSRSAATTSLGDERANELFPALTFNGPYMALPGTHDDLEGIPERIAGGGGVVEKKHRIPPAIVKDILEADSLLAAYSGLPSGLVHSNCWALSGELTASGMPILANDYHMPLILPSLWYEAHLSGDGIDVMGITLPGFPSIIAGHNRYAAWGATTTGGDTQDIFIEKTNPENDDEYLSAGRYEPFEKITERIYYKEGKEQKYVDETILVSRHGPVINSIVSGLGDDAPPLAIKTVDGAMDGALAFSMDIVKVQSWEEFRDALSHFNAFVWNWVYADAGGTIGFTVSGKIPIRKKGSGLEPAAGWTGEYEWIGFIPSGRFPEVRNPATGYIVTANNEISDGRYPYSIQPTAFVLPYRAIRIEELLTSLGPATYESTREIQGDTMSTFCHTLSRLVIDAVKDNTNEDDRIETLVEYLEKWDGSADTESIGMTIAFEVFVQAMGNLYGTKLDDELYKSFTEQMYYSAGVLLLMLSDDSYTFWYDNPDTEAVEGRDELLIQSLRDADVALSTFFGEDIDSWRWGEIHTYTFKHALGSVPPFKWLFNIGPFPFPGDLSTVRPGYASDITKKPYEVTEGSSMRHVIDFGDFDGAELVISTGQSERWLSPHYDDQTRLWMEVTHIPMWMERDDIEANAAAVTIFEPKE
jgi:penicillin amidase